MTAVERLRRDHERLRVKLQIVEGARSFGAEAQLVIQEVCFTLARQLRDHAKEEERLTARCSRQLGRYGPEELAWFAIDHREELGRLHLINRCLAQISGAAQRDGLGAPLATLLGQLRAQMDAQEKTLLPFLEERLAETTTDGQAPPARSRVLTETMTADEVLQAHPETRVIFEQLFVSLPFEAYDRLEDIAWRHGLRSHQLLAYLEAAICGEGRPHARLSERELMPAR